LTLIPCDFVTTSAIVSRNSGSPAVQDRFGESGQPFDLMVEFGLTHNEVCEAVKKVLKRKKG